MNKICMNPVCERIQETDGCVAADWCPYYIGGAHLVTSYTGSNPSSDASIPLRLIDADALRNKFNDLGQDIDVLDVLCIIDEQPTIDAMPVLRCGKCECGKPDEEPQNDGKKYVWCKWWRAWRPEDGFCDMGKKTEAEK